MTVRRIDDTADFSAMQDQLDRILALIDANPPPARLERCRYCHDERWIPKLAGTEGAPDAVAPCQHCNQMRWWLWRNGHYAAGHLAQGCDLCDEVRLRQDYRRVDKLASGPTGPTEPAFVPARRDLD